jgi:hypothetical protein
MVVIDEYVFDNDLYEFEQCTDNRTWKSNVYDINGGDNFADYCEYIFDILEEEEYFED